MASISISLKSLSPPLISSPITSIRRRPKRAAIAVRAAASSGDGKARQWWAPLFPSIIKEPDGSKGLEPVEGGSEMKTGRSRLTAEKARMLRQQMRESESWHDAMYHSAIASRLASSDKH